MPEIARQDCQPALLRCCGDDDVGKSRRMSETARPIRHRAGDPRRCRIEGKNAITIKMQDRIEPRRQSGAFACDALAPLFRNSIPDLRHRDGRQK
jgi:hypothetical protein